MTVFHVLKYYQFPIKCSSLPQTVQDAWVGRIRRHTDELVDKVYPSGVTKSSYEEQRDRKRETMDSLKFYLQWLVDARDMIALEDRIKFVTEMDDRRAANNREELKRFQDFLREELLNYEGPV